MLCLPPLSVQHAACHREQVLSTLSGHSGTQLYVALDTKPKVPSLPIIRRLMISMGSSVGKSTRAFREYPAPQPLHLSTMDQATRLDWIHQCYLVLLPANMRWQRQELLQQSQEAALPPREAAAARSFVIETTSRTALVGAKANAAARSAGRDQGLRRITCGALDGKLAANEGSQLAVTLHPLGQVLNTCHQVLVTLHKQSRT